jgi:hypothetical protein
MIPVSLRYLLDRVRYPRMRANELSHLRRRFSELSTCSDLEREVALQLRSRKQELSALLQGVSSCSRCNQQHPRPEGPWSGGYCCSAPTTNLFTDDEITALVASGVDIHMLQPPNEEQHGCVFRGALGCSIAPEERPSICVRYLCVTLELELARRGKMSQIDALRAELKEQLERFSALRAKRLEEEYFMSLLNE